MNHNFRELKIWKESMNFVKMVYSITKLLPNEERFGLISHVNRCSVSIPSNIAEGSGRTTQKEFLHFLNIAVSSSFELETQLLLIVDLFKVDCSECLVKVIEVQKMISGFKKAITNNNIKI